MRKIFIACLSLLSLAATAQITVTEVTTSMSKGSQPGFSVTVPASLATQFDAAIRAEMKYLKAKVEQDKSSGEYFADDVKVTDISALPVDIYAIISPVSTGASATLFFNTNNSWISSSNATAATAAKNIVSDIGKMVKGGILDAQIDAESKTRKDMEKALSDLQADKAKIDKNITDNNNSISGEETNIKSQTASLDALKKTAADNQAKVAAKKTEISSVDAKSLEGQQKTLESEKKDLQDANTKLLAQIAEKKSEIEKLNSEIAALQKSVDDNNGIITTKTNAIAEVQSKISGGTANVERMGEELKALQATAKESDKAVDDSQKAIDKSNDNIAKLKAANTDLSSKIPANTSAQTAKQAEIDAQKKKLEELKAERAKYNLPR